MLNSPSAGIPWYVSVRPSVENGVEYLGVYLSYNNIIDNDDRWSVVATFELRLLNESSNSGDVVKINKDRVFKKPEEFTGWGWRKFVTVAQLRSGSFIQDDTIKIRAHLSTESFERIRDY